jgi:hypothetical protein
MMLLLMLNAEDGDSTGSVGIATGYGQNDRGSIPCRGTRFSLLYSVQTGSGFYQLPIQWVPGQLSLGVKWTGREAEHSPPSGVEIKKCGTMDTQ